MSSRIFLVIGFLFCSTTLFCPSEDLPQEVSEFIENAKKILHDAFEIKMPIQIDPLQDLQTGTIADALARNDLMNTTMAVGIFTNNLSIGMVRHLFNVSDLIRQHSHAIFQALDAEIAEMNFVESVFNQIRFCRPADQAIDFLPPSPVSAAAPTLHQIVAFSHPPMETALLPVLPSIEVSPAAETWGSPVDGAQVLSLDDFIKKAKDDLRAVFAKRVKYINFTGPNYEKSVEEVLRGGRVTANVKYSEAFLIFFTDPRIMALRQGIPADKKGYEDIIHSVLDQEIIKKGFDWEVFKQIRFWDCSLGKIIEGRIVSDGYLTEEQYKERLKLIRQPASPLGSPSVAGPNPSSSQDSSVKPKTILPRLFRLQNIAAFVCLVAGGAGFLWAVLRKPKKDHKKTDRRSSKSKVPMVLFGGLFLGSAGFLVLTNR